MAQMTLNEYVVESDGKVSDADFIRAYSKTEVYFNVLDPSLDIAADGFQVSPYDKIEFETVSTGAGVMGVFYASKDDSRLSERFSGMPLIQAAWMICDFQGADGLLLQSNSGARIVAKKKNMRAVIGSVRDSVLIKHLSQHLER
jgi:hypothetical protein